MSYKKGNIGVTDSQTSLTHNDLQSSIKQT